MFAPTFVLLFYFLKSKIGPNSFFNKCLIKKVTYFICVKYTNTELLSKLVYGAFYLKSNFSANLPLFKSHEMNMHVDLFNH
jgi:hypothetical protein